MRVSTIIASSVRRYRRYLEGSMWLVYAMIAAVFWGINYALAEKIGQSISLITMLGIEMLVGSIIALTIAYFTSMTTDFTILCSNSTVLRLVIIQVIIVTVASLFIVMSIQSKNATVAGLVEITYPLFTIIATWLLFQEHHLNVPILIGGGLIFLGVLLISVAS